MQDNENAIINPYGPKGSPYEQSTDLHKKYIGEQIKETKTKKDKVAEIPQELKGE